MPARIFFQYFLFRVHAYTQSTAPWGEPGAVTGVRWCWRVEEGLNGARSMFQWLGVACPSKLEGSMNGLFGLLWGGRLCIVQVNKGRLDLQNKTQAVLTFATKLKFTGRAPQCEHQQCRANEGRSEHRASREAGDGAHCGREGRKASPGPNRWRGGRQTGGWRARLTETLCCSLCFSLPVQGVPIRLKKEA